MVSLANRKLLRRLRVLDFARSIKSRFVSVQNSFSPCTPHLLIAVNRSLRLLAENGHAEGGDYLEFGIFRGFTLWYTQALAADFGIRDLRFFGFDSFFGLPPIVSIDTGGEFQEGAYYAPRHEVEHQLTQYGVDWTRTTLVEGWFHETLNAKTRKQYSLRRCAICVIDCDIYESTRSVLEFIEPLVDEGSILLFDDWTSFENGPDKGEQRAFDEFLQRNPNIQAEQFIEFGGHGVGFILHVGDGPAQA